MNSQMQARASSLHGVSYAPATGVRVLVRAAYLALLIAFTLLPALGSSFWSYPGVEHPWVLALLCAVFVLPLIDIAHLRSRTHLDVLALASFAGAVAFWSPQRSWQLLCVYAPLAYLAVRMLSIARSGPRVGSAATGAPTSPCAPSAPGAVLPRAWLIAGIVVLLAVHVAWSLDSRASTDIGYASVRGALQLAHGQALYAPEHGLTAKLGYDPHYDTYGPATYEAYLPFALLASERTAERLAALFFDLLTAALLFLLGRRIRGPSLGVLLAYAWLAFPVTFYADSLGANDALVAAALAGTLLASGRPARRGGALAIAAWAKLGALALVPLLAVQGGRARTRRAWPAFAVGFALVSAALFVPALAHSSAGTFLSRTFGFQLSRTAAYSIWAQFEAGGQLSGPGWAHAAGAVGHGVCAALAGGVFVTLLLGRAPHTTPALAAGCAAVLICLVACASYLSVTYVLWFAPLALLASLAGCAAGADPGAGRLTHAP